MRIRRKIKKAISLILVTALIIGGSFSSITVDKAYAGDPLTMSAVTTILQALRNVFTGVALGRAGLSSNSSTDNIIQVSHDIEDDIMGGEAIMQYLASPLPWMQGIDYTISKMFEYSTYEEYCDYYNYDETDTSILNLYITDNNLGSIDQVSGNISLKNSTVNRFSEFMRKYKTELTEKLDLVITNTSYFPAMDEYTFYYDGKDHHIKMSDILSENNISLNQGNFDTIDFIDNEFSSNIQNIIGTFVGPEGFNILNSAFIFSTNGSKYSIMTIPDDSVFIMDSTFRIFNVLHYPSFVYYYCNKFYGSNLIHNSDSEYSSGYSSERTYSPSFFPGWSIYSYENGSWSICNRSSQNYDLFAPYFPYRHQQTYPQKYFFNFSNLKSVLALVDSRNNELSNNYHNVSTILNNFSYFTTYKLFKGVNFTYESSLGINLSGEDDYLPVVPMEILDYGADVSIDPYRATEINAAYEDGSTAGTAETYLTILPDIVANLSDILYKTSSVYKVVLVISGAISAIQSLISAIPNKIDTVAPAVGQAIGQYFIDATDNTNLLGHLKPIDNIADTVADMPGWFVDATSGDSYAEQIASGVNNLVHGISIDNAGEEAETLGNVIDDIRTGINTIALSLGGEEAAADDATTVAGAIAIAATTDPTTNQPRSQSSLTNIIILPLLFIFILLLIIWIMLKALAFAALIFRTPVSTAFIPVYMQSGLNWLKTTEISSAGGSLSMQNVEGVSSSGLFSGVTIWGIMIFCIDLIAMFAILKVVKRWADRQHGD